MNPTKANSDWTVFEYEVRMFRCLLALLKKGNQEFPDGVQYAIVESVVLHTRQLVDILLSRGKKRDDIKLSSLLPCFQSIHLDTLDKHYGKAHERNSPCWIINKRLAHPTSERGDSFDYSRLLSKLVPKIEVLLQKINDHHTLPGCAVKLASPLSTSTTSSY